MELKFIVLLGALGAGKGTQTEALERVLAEDGKSLCVVLYIKVSTETLLAWLGSVDFGYAAIAGPSSILSLTHPKKRASVISAVANEEVQADMLNAIEASC